MHSGNSKTLSLVTPVLNGARYFPQLLDTIRQQQVRPFQYIVVDGGSTDGTLDIIQEYSDVVTDVIHHPIPGIYEAVRCGFNCARGDVLGWINADDMLFPWSIRCVLDYFEGSPECNWISGVPTMFDEAGRMVWCAQIAPRYPRWLVEKGLYSSLGLGPIQQESVFFTRSLYEKVGGVDARYRLAGDFDLWRRFARHERLFQAGTVLAGFRLHGRNRSIGAGRYHDEAAAVRIPAGKLLGAAISFVAFLCERRARKFRLDGDMVKI